MQEKESIIVVRCELKIPSLGMPNTYLRDRIFSPHLTTINDSYNGSQLRSYVSCREDTAICVMQLMIIQLCAARYSLRVSEVTDKLNSLLADVRFH